MNYKLLIMKTYIESTVMYILALTLTICGYLRMPQEEDVDSGV